MLGISIAGAAIACCEPVAPGAAIGLLRFYWFRLADVIVPLSLAVSAAAVLEDDAACHRLGLLPPAAWTALRLLAPMLAEVRESATTYLSCVFPLHLDVIPNAFKEEHRVPPKYKIRVCVYLFVRAGVSV